MKVNELMIGDWVIDSYGNHSKIQQIYCVENILHKRCYLVEHNNCSSYVEQLEPIPLTEEMLKANGFEIEKSREEWTVLLLSEEDGVVDTELEFNYDVENGDYYIGFGDVRNISFIYVHELQHALRLCGLNDLADNFKLQADE